MREKAILVSPDEFRSKDSVPDFIRSQVKICEGEMLNVFPLLRFFSKNFFSWQFFLAPLKMVHTNRNWAWNFIMLLRLLLFTKISWFLKENQPGLTMNIPWSWFLKIQKWIFRFLLRRPISSSRRFLGGIQCVRWLRTDSSRSGSNGASSFTSMMSDLIFPIII